LHFEPLNTFNYIPNFLVFLALISILNQLFCKDLKAHANVTTNKQVDSLGWDLTVNFEVGELNNFGRTVLWANQRSSPKVYPNWIASVWVVRVGACLLDDKSLSIW
jgi:hypothetical protein